MLFEGITSHQEKKFKLFPRQHKTAGSTYSERKSTEKMIKPFMKRRFYTATEVSEHNFKDDCWVSFMGKVYNVTSLIIEHKVLNGGRDITHWFDKETGDIRKWIDPITNERCYYTPMGRFLHIPLPSYEPETTKEPVPTTPWWKDDGKYMIGKLSKKTRIIRIVNTLTHDEHELEVCSEETLKEILDRYLHFNSHAGSYTWKRLGEDLDMEKTLEENGIRDEDKEFEELGINDNFYRPALHLYYNDDLTIG